MVDIRRANYGGASYSVVCMSWNDEDDDSIEYFTLLVVILAAYGLGSIIWELIKI